MAGNTQNTIQDSFLNSCRKEKSTVTIYLTSGIKLQGHVTGFDNFSLLLKRGSVSQLVYKHGIATIVPSDPIGRKRNTTKKTASKADKTEAKAVESNSGDNTEEENTENIEENVENKEAAEAAVVDSSVVAVGEVQNDEKETG